MSQDRPVNRRGFLKAGAVATLAGCATTGGNTTRTDVADNTASAPPGAPVGDGMIRAWRRLGKTGWTASDIGMGTGRLADSNVVRYAYDKGVNYFDTAEAYGNGDSERKIGQAMRHMDRSKIWITTKLKLTDHDTKQTVLDRFQRCLDRMQTPYADALYIHSCTNLAHVEHKGFHAATAQLKADGKLRHIGISSHGPRGAAGDSMEQVLLKAANDGRFDLMLLVYNFLRRDAGDKILAACRENNVGATLMKTAPARLRLEPVDPDNLTEEYAARVELSVARGATREEAIAGLTARVERQRQAMAAGQGTVDRFVARHGIKAELELRKKSILWSVTNPLATTAVVSMPDFEAVDRFVPLSGQSLSRDDQALLRDFERLHSQDYCRHGCNDCASACPSAVPVSTVMRYAYYFEQQGREKYAMGRYAGLPQNATACVGCAAPCEQACPHGLAVPLQLSAAHRRLSLA